MGYDNEGTGEEPLAPTDSGRSAIYGERPSSVPNECGMAWLADDSGDTRCRLPKGHTGEHRTEQSTPDAGTDTGVVPPTGPNRAPAPVVRSAPDVTPDGQPRHRVRQVEDFLRARFPVANTERIQQAAWELGDLFEKWLPSTDDVGAEPDSVERIAAEWGRLLAADNRRCPEGDDYTEMLQEADRFVRRLIVASRPSAVDERTDALRWMLSLEQRVVLRQTIEHALSTKYGPEPTGRFVGIWMNPREAADVVMEALGSAPSQEADA